jgi:multiple sugar transport system permease protein
MARTEALPVATRRARATKRERREALTFYLLVSPFIAGFLIFTLIPMVGSILLSFTSWDFIHTPTWVGLQNYQNLSSDQDYIQGIKVTLSYAAMALPAGLIMSLVLALLMNRPIPGVNVFRAIYYMPSLLAGFSVAALWIFVFDYQHGILNQVLRAIGLPPVGWLIDPNWALKSFVLMGLWGIGNTILIYLAGLKGIPQQLYEAADIDGAGWWARLRHATLPMLSPTIFFNLVVGLIGVFQYFDQSYVMTNGGPPIIQGNQIVGSTRFYMLKLYNDAFRAREFGYAASEAVVLFVFILIITLLVIRSSALWVYYEGNVVKGK